MSNGDSESTFALLAILIVSISVLAMLLNGILYFLLSKIKRKETFSAKLIKIMSPLDLITGISRCASFIIYSSYGNEVLDSTWYCRIFGFTTFCVPCLSFIFISVLALERYLVLCQSTKLNPIYTILIVIALCFIILIPNLIVMINSSYSPDPSRSYCLPLGSTATEISKHLFEYLITVSYFVTAFCYLNIMTFYPNDSNFNSTLHMIWLRALLLFFAYSISFTPVIYKILCNYLVYMKAPAVLKIAIPVCITGITGITAIDPVLVLALYRPLSKELISYFKPRDKIGSTIELHPKPDYNEFK